MAEDESKDGASLEALVERLKGSRRRGRQEAAHEIAMLAKADPSRWSHMPTISSTRWIAPRPRRVGRCSTP